MDKIGEALIKLVESGGPLGALAIKWWFIVRISESISRVLIALVAFGALVIIGFKIVNAIREWNKGT